MADHLPDFTCTAVADTDTVQKELLNFSLDVICSVDAGGCFTYVTAAAKDMWGYDPCELIGRPYIDLVAPNDKAKTAAIAEAIMNGSTVTNFENRFVRKDGTTVPLLWSARWQQKEQTMYSVARDATAMHENNRKTRLAEQRLLKAYKLGKIGWWEWDAYANQNSASDELYEIYGLSRDVVPTITTEVYLSLVHPEDLPDVQKQLQFYLTNGQKEYEHRIIRPSGEIAYLVHYLETEVDESGQPVLVHGITKDITARKAAELKLKASEQKLTTILESIGDCFFAVDRHWTVTYWNSKAEEVLQKKRGDILGKNLWEEYRAALPLKFYQEYHRAVAENVVVRFEEFFPPLNMWVEVSAYPSAEGLSVYFKNVTERKIVAEALHQSNQRYELVSKATSDAIWDWNLETGKIFWGEGFTLNFGSPASPANDIDLWSANLHPDDAARVKKKLEAAVKGNELNWSDEYRYCKTDGTYAVVIDRGFLIRDETGKALRMVGAMQDITLQKEAEKSLRLSEERFRLLFFQSPKPKWMFNGETLQIVEANQAALELYGYTREEFLQLSLVDLRIPADLPLLYQVRGENLHQYKNTVRHCKKSGEQVLMDISTHLIDLPAGRHFIVAGDDVTEKTKLQQMVIEEKIAAQKEIARAIIHAQEHERSEIAKELHDNVNQLLTTAKLYIENTRYFPEQQESFGIKSIGLLQRSIDEIRVLSKQLVTPDINDIGFKATIEELLQHYSSLRLFDIRLCYSVCELELDKGLELTIYRIIQEQLNNIVKYAKASQVQVRLFYEPSLLIVCINDDGVGFEPANAAKGLGLKNIKNRAEVYKGTVNIRSAAGAGTTVTVRFPRQLLMMDKAKDLA
jgi:PAS domain S-box-containing protein